MFASSAPTRRVFSESFVCENPGGDRRAHRVPQRCGTRAARRLPRPDRPRRPRHLLHPLPRRPQADSSHDLGFQPPGVRPATRHAPFPGLLPGRPEYSPPDGRRLRGEATRRRPGRDREVWPAGPDADRAPPANPPLPRLPQGHGQRPGPARTLARGSRPGARPTHRALAPGLRTPAGPPDRTARDHSSGSASSPRPDDEPSRRPTDGWARS